MRTRNRQPTSPGEILSEEFLKPAGLTQNEFAAHLQVDVKTINRLIKGRTRLSPALALRIAAAVGTSVEFWLNLQAELDTYQCRQADANLPTILPEFAPRP
jgi:addiction module HigA family antidote